MTEKLPGSEPLKNPKRERFCLEYVKDLIAKQAAIRAGYSEKTAEAQGSRLLSFVKVQERVAYLIKNKHDEIDISAERILRELFYLATSDITDCLETGERDLVIFKKIDDIPESVTRAIKSIEYDNKSGKGKIKFAFHSKEKALELLGKYRSLFVERFKVDSPVILEVSEKFAPDIPDENKNQGGKP